MLRRFIHGHDPPDVPESLDWDRFENIAAVNGLIPILYVSMNSSQVPQARLERWKHISIGVSFGNQRALQATVRMLTILQEEGIPAVTLRGIAMAHRVYSDPALRPMSDVDILVPEDANGYIVDRLEAHGLSPCKVRRYQFLYEVDDIVIELHWSYLTTKRYRRAADFNEWIDSRRKTQLPEGVLYFLSPEHQLLDLICHAFLHHELDSIQKLVDIAMLIHEEDLDWNYIRLWCQNSRMTRLILFTLAVTDYLLDLGIEPELKQYNLHFPERGVQMFEAYISRMFCQDLPICFLRRQRTMLWVAEKPFLKLTQLIRFISADHISECFQLLFTRTRTPNDRYLFQNTPEETSTK